MRKDASASQTGLSSSTEPKVSAASAASIPCAMQFQPRELVPPDEFDTSDQYTTLKWRFIEHRDGETALFDLCGLHVWVMDMDGDASEWTIRRGRWGSILSSGSRWEGNHFFACLRDAEAAFRKIVDERITELRTRASATEAAAAGETQSGSTCEGAAPSGETPKETPRHLTPTKETETNE